MRSDTDMQCLPKAPIHHLPIAFFLATFASLPGVVHSQNTQPPAAKQQTEPTPVFRVSTSVVTVNVVVTGQYHQPVDSLQAKDFTLLEDGKRQTIRFFELHSLTEKKQAATPALQLPANQFTNFRNQDPGGVINIVLFDMLNTPMEDQVYARRQLLEFLRRIPPGQRVALFTLGTRLRMVQGFTDDAANLLEVANDIRPGMSAINSSSEKPEQQEGTEGRGFGNNSRFAQALAAEEDFRIGYRVGLTVDAIGAISRAVSGLPGRKNLLWLSAGFPLNMGPDAEMEDPMRNIGSYQSQVNRLGIALASSQMAVYPIDVRGLVINGFDAATSRSMAFDPSRNVKDMSWLWSTHEMMNQIAEQTGGQAYYNTNGVLEAMQRTVERGSHYYTLAYVPANRDWNGKYRNIEVKTKDQNLSLQYRRGYLALPDKKIEGQLPLRMLAQAMQPGFPDSTMLLMKAQVLPPDDAHPMVRIDYSIVTSNLTFLDVPGKGKTATVDFAAAAFDQKGEQAGLEVHRVEGTLRPEDMRLGFTAHQEIRLRPGSYILKIGAIDITSQKIGTIEVPLTVPVTRHSGVRMTGPSQEKR